MGFDLRVLGPVELVDDGSPIALPGRKHRRLLAALVLAGGRVVSVDSLVDAVWGESPPPSARKLLQLYVSQLRKALPARDIVATRGSGYALELDGSSIDAVRFERLAREAAELLAGGNAALGASLAERALALWRGPAYADVMNEDFARAEADRLEELRLEALDTRIEARLALGQHDGVLASAVALADEHPSRERAQRLAMLALYRSGRLQDALDRFTDVSRRLDEDLGLEPSHELRELRRRLLEQDPSLDLEAPVPESSESLPVSRTPLVGRDAELVSLRDILARREIRLLVMMGVGGSGKTRLALEAAREAAPSFANGAAIVELAPLRDPALVAATIARAVDVAEVPGEAPEKTLERALADHELLLMVDNAEHLREAAPLYARLVARAPRLTVLVTSRAVLHVSGEQVFPVAPLAEDDAVELFVQRARLLEPAFALSPENEADVRDICRRLDCLPLAIELAAARSRALTPRGLRERLDSRLALLTGGPRDLPPRQQALRGTIAWSVDLLGRREREAFVRLAVLPGGATLEAAETVCGADLDTLATLVDDHLVMRDDVGDEPRFRMLETVREYALELLGEERPEAERSLAEYFGRRADEIRLSPVDWWRAVERLELEADNVRVALAAAESSGDTELWVRLVGGLWRYWYTRGPVGEALEWIERALAVAASTATAARASAIQGASALAWLRGEPERAKKLAHAAISVAVEANSPFDELAANNILGFVARGEGDWVTARRHHYRALELKEQLGIEPVAEKLNLGVIALDLKEHDDAIALFEDVLDSHRRNDNLRGMTYALCNLGLGRYEVGDHEGSQRDFDEARAWAERTGQREQLGYALQGLAAANATNGRFEMAAILLGQARRELDKLGTPEDKFSPEMLAATTATTREAIGVEAFEAGYAAGLAEGLEEMTSAVSSTELPAGSRG